MVFLRVQKLFVQRAPLAFLVAVLLVRLVCLILERFLLHLLLGEVLLYLFEVRFDLVVAQVVEPGSLVLC